MAGSGAMNMARRVALRLGRVGLDTWTRMQAAQLWMTAASLAYITILSVVPLMAVSFAVFQAFGGLQKLYTELEPVLLSNLAEGTKDQVLVYLERFIRNTHTATVGVGGFLGLVFTSMSMLANIESAFNRVWGAKKARPLFQRVSTYWLFITLGPMALSIGVGIATSSGGSAITRLVPHATAMFAIWVVALWAVYGLVPNCRVDWKFSLLSAVITSALFDLSRLGFNLYIKSFSTYNRIYGSVAAVPILLFWIYIVWVILLTGAALDAALQGRLEPPTGGPGAFSPSKRVSEGAARPGTLPTTDDRRDARA